VAIQFRDIQPLWNLGEGPGAVEEPHLVTVFENPLRDPLCV
jgi:hypothetical protein